MRYPADRTRKRIAQSACTAVFLLLFAIDRNNSPGLRTEFDWLVHPWAIRTGVDLLSVTVFNNACFHIYIFKPFSCRGEFKWESNAIPHRKIIGTHVYYSYQFFRCFEALFMIIIQ